MGEIESSHDVPRQFGAKILQKLMKAGIVKSVRGLKGGYVLAADPKDISLLDVYEAASGPLALNVCVEENTNCGRSGSCRAHPVWTALTDNLTGEMKSWNFQRLLGGQRT